MQTTAGNVLKCAFMVVKTPVFSGVSIAGMRLSKTRGHYKKVSGSIMKTKRNQPITLDAEGTAHKPKERRKQQKKRG
jgi:hypothetical protein